MFGSMRPWAVMGSLCLLAACGGGGGGGGSTSQPQDVPPVARATASGAVQMTDGRAHATLAGQVVLDASGSSDADGDALTYAWSLVSAPQGSTLAVSATSAALTWQPDAMGTYVFAVAVTDTHGAMSSQQVTVVVDNAAPTASVTVAATFAAVVTQQPAQDVTLGASVVLDATNTTDPDGDAVQVTFDLVSPGGSTASLVSSGRTTRFTPDTLGTYVVQVHGVDTHGASFEADYPFDVDNRVPNPVTAFDVQAVVADGGAASMTTSVGYDVAIDAGASTDADGDALTFAWVLSAKPAGSAAALTGADGAAGRGLSPDMLGDYVVVLTVTDSHGAQSRRTLTVTANNRRPVAVLTTNATPQSLPSAPAVTVPLGTLVTLSGSASTDADGDAITDAWSIDAAPSGSRATLSSTSAVAPTFTADVEGAYTFRLRATDVHGAFSERTVVLDVGTHPPVAVIDRTAVTVERGSSVGVSAALSFDEDGDPLTYRWTVDARPSASTATLASATAAAATFTPDLAGLYVLAAHVSDGHRTSTAYVTVHALAGFQASVALNFVPVVAHYDLGLDKVVIAGNGPNALHVVDPFSGVQTAVALPAPVKLSFRLSPDGRLAAVLHEGAVSLVDLTTSTLLHSSLTGGSQTDLAVTNQGIIYLTGQTGGQWVNGPVTVIDGRTGALSTPSIDGYTEFYGTDVAVMAPSLGRIFYISEGLSPAQLCWFSFDANGTQPMTGGEGPYWGDYALGVPLWVASDDSLVFTAAGTYFRTDTLRYGGVLAGVTNLVGLDDSASQQEVLALSSTTDYSSYPFPMHLATSYQRFTGPLLVADASMPLPSIGGLQSYGVDIWHSAAGRHVVLVQTGGDVANASGLAYAVVAR